MKALAEQIAELDEIETYGRVVGVRGLMVEVAGPIHAMSVGSRVIVEAGGGRLIPCEVVGFTGQNALLMPFAPLEGVRRGCRRLHRGDHRAAPAPPAFVGRGVVGVPGPEARLGPFPPPRRARAGRPARRGTRGGG